MTEDEAQSWIVAHFGEATKERLAVFVERVLLENERQNLISPASMQAIWARHVVDSAQLILLAPDDWRSWLDVGTGGGFPGMVVALAAAERSVIMVEPRARRAAFLKECVETLELPNASVRQAKVEAIQTQADVISARAVASVDKLSREAAHCAMSETIWLLPRGRSAAERTGSKRSMFHVEHSITDRESIILKMRGIPR